jgi:hypothetical protein
MLNWNLQYYPSRKGIIGAVLPVYDINFESIRHILFSKCHSLPHVCITLFRMSTSFFMDVFVTLTMSSASPSCLPVCLTYPYVCLFSPTSFVCDLPKYRSVSQSVHQFKPTCLSACLISPASVCLANPYDCLSRQTVCTICLSDLPVCVCLIYMYVHLSHIIVCLSVPPTRMSVCPTYPYVCLSHLPVCLSLTNLRVCLSHLPYPFVFPSHLRLPYS